MLSLVHRGQKNRIFTTGNRHFYNGNCSTTFLWFWRLLGRLKNEQKRKKKKKKMEKMKKEQKMKKKC